MKSLAQRFRDRKDRTNRWNSWALLADSYQYGEGRYKNKIRLKKEKD